MDVSTIARSQHQFSSNESTSLREVDKCLPRTLANRLTVFRDSDTVLMLQELH